MKVYVIGGGNSPEREVSLRSSKAVCNALISAGYEVVYKDLRDGVDFLDDALPSDIVFPILHGAEGEDGQIQKILESKSLPFLGTGSEASFNCFDKDITRKMLADNAIKVADGASIKSSEYKQHPLHKKPHVIKVQRGGSSIGTYLVHDPAQIDWDKVEYGFSLDSDAIIEELIEGTEITVPVLDGNALPVIEIKPPENCEFDYENKYNGKTQEICPSVGLSQEQQKEAQLIAEKVHKVMACRHLSRTDIIVDKNGQMYVLEVNTMPGLTHQSLFPKAAKAAGLEMTDLVKKFVSLVQRDRRTR